MSNIQTILIDLLIIHIALFFISLIVISIAKGTAFSKKCFQAAFALLVPIIGPLLGIYIHLSDRAKPPPPHDPNWQPMNGAPEDWGQGHH